MKLSKPIITSPQVHPICLWETHLHYSQQIAGHIGMVNAFKYIFKFYRTYIITYMYWKIVGSDLNNMYKISELRVYQAPVKVLSEEKCKNIDLTFYKQIVEPGICFIYLRGNVNQQ